MYRNIRRPDTGEDFHSHDHRGHAAILPACGNLVSSQDRTDLQADLVGQRTVDCGEAPTPKSHGSRETGQGHPLLQTARQMYLLIIQQM